DWPANSHLIAKGLIKIHDPDGEMETAGSWGGFYLFTYALLNEGTSPADFEAKLTQVDEEFVDPIFDQFGVTVKYEAIALPDIHLKSTFQGEPEPVGSMEYIYVFGAIGLFLLILACINYMNLATARSQKRAREVGVRKTMGAVRGHLISQFIAESLIMAGLALLVSFGVVYLSLPFFNQILDLPLQFSGLFRGEVMLALLGILVLTGLASGSYPAFYLSSFHPALVLKGTSGKSTGSNKRLREGLVVLQFVISLFMLVSTGVVYDQLRYLDNKDLGFTESPVLTFAFSNPEDQAKWEVLRQKILKVSGIEGAATTQSVPGNGYGKNLMPMETNEGEMVERGIDGYPVDYDYFSTMEMSIIEGRDFDRSRGLDSSRAVIVNEAMVKRLAWDEPIGKKVVLNFSSDEPIEAQVIGVIKNFHQQSLYEEITPLMFTRQSNNRSIVVRLSPAQVEATLSGLKQAWQEVFPNAPFEYEFLDEA
ncbi:MAG: FtsX-like permease family protein, partial [Bacteroidota bacterium]